MKSQKIPMEWMGPPTWRLPSGKALAEYALQSGFLAPVLLGSIPFKKSMGWQFGDTAVASPQTAKKFTKVSR